LRIYAMRFYACAIHLYFSAICQIRQVTMCDLTSSTVTCA
jgi:hypothetical protein